MTSSFYNQVVPQYERCIQRDLNSPQCCCGDLDIGRDELVRTLTQGEMAGLNSHSSSPEVGQFTEVKLLAQVLVLLLPSCKTLDKLFKVSCLSVCF